MTRIVTVDELREHNKSTDCWVAIHGRVYDLTRFLPEHPGGGEVISSISGADVTHEFEDIGHSDSARRSAGDFFVGFIEGSPEANATDAETHIPLLQSIRRSDNVGLDTRTVVVAGIVVIAAALAAYLTLGKRL